MRVDYTWRFDYRYDPVDGQRYPILTMELVNPGDPDRRVAVDAYIDSGCSRSLFDARLALVIGVDPTRGTMVPFVSATGVTLMAVMCPVKLEHPELGGHLLEVGFSQICLKRNLLGRDFLGHIQLGLREHRQELLIKAEP